MMKYDYKFSIVTGVYNTEEYLGEMIESVINQDMEFEKNVQLILVDDGSTDKSYEKCLEYVNKYPNNIVCIKNCHKGVSTARNIGLKYAKGKYVNFLDSDDKLESNVLSNVCNFFEKNYEEIDLVSIPLYLFDAEEGNHILNYKFTGNRIIDVREEYKAIQLSSSSTFIKKEVIDRYEFDEKMKYAEDALLVNKIILEKYKYGVVSDCKYLYRKRKNITSATQSNIRDKKWYLNSLENFSMRIIDYEKKIKGEVSLYIQYLVMYEMQWKINMNSLMKETLSSGEVNEFNNKVSKILKNIKTKIILQQECLSRVSKLNLFKYKIIN